MPKKRASSSGSAEAEQFQAILDYVKQVGRGDLTQRVDGKEFSEDHQKLLGGIEKLVKRFKDSRSLLTSLTVGISECQQVLSSVRGGNMDARISDLVVQTDDELVSSLATQINETIETTSAMLDAQRRQQDIILELSTPLLQVWDDILVLPIIGVVDSMRSAEIMERLLEEIVTKQSKYVIIDITGVPVVDTGTADHFIRLTKAAELLGAKSVLTGIRPAVAQTLVAIGLELSSVTTLHNLQAALRYCLRELRKSKTGADVRSLIQQGETA